MFCFALAVISPVELELEQSARLREAAAERFSRLVFARAANSNTPGSFRDCVQWKPSLSLSLFIMCTVLEYCRNTWNEKKTTHLHAQYNCNDPRITLFKLKA